MKLYLLITVISMTIIFGGTAETEIKLTSFRSMIQLDCGKDNITFRHPGNTEFTPTPSSSLKIKNLCDTDSWEYHCSSNDKHRALIFIKCCLNCVEFDTGSILGIVIGDLVAIIVIGVAVYSISTAGEPQDHRAADRQALVPNEATAAIYSGIDQSDRQEYDRPGFRGKK
ncbi:T-cell surface glycoprotein CD3 gamma chain-like isoform X3 [Mustelus asterias]